MTRKTTFAAKAALCINDPALVERAEIIRDKGTNRRQFFRGQVDKYTWVDVGSSYVLSELCAAFLLGQLEKLDDFVVRRREIYHQYDDLLGPLAAEGRLRLPWIPDHCDSNYHMFYTLLPTPELRDALIGHLKSHGIHAVFHYVPLHTSPMGQHIGRHGADLPVTEDLASRLVRLPMFGDLSGADHDRISQELMNILQTNCSMTSDN